MPNATRTLSEVISCLSDYDPDALPVAQARNIIHEFVTPIHAIEQVAIRSALDRILAEDVISPTNVPSHDNSAMDGYALRGSDLNADTAVTLKVAGTAYAGRRYDGTVGSGECVRIMTGAMMPASCDTVVPQEFARSLRDIDHDPRRHRQNRR
jgi:molybdopterin molybdotransferase